MGMVLRFLDELPVAARAADVDLTTATGNTDGLPALGTVEITVLFVLQMGEETQKSGVFPASGGDIPGIHTKNTPEQGRIAQNCENTAKGSGASAEHRTQNRQHQTANK